MQQIKRSRTRIFHNPESKNQPLTISRPSNRYVHVEWTVHVPRINELPRSIPGTKSPPSSPVVHPSKRTPAINFATWLDEHFKLNGQKIQRQGLFYQISAQQQLILVQQANNLRPIHNQPVNGSSPKQSIQKDSLPSAKNLHSLPEFLVQFANKNAKMSTPGLISAARTVEIPTNEEAIATNAQKQLNNQVNSRKSQRLMEKTEELRNRQTAVCVQSSDRQYKEVSLMIVVFSLKFL
jgi:hypothetical protein